MSKNRPIGLFLICASFAVGQAPWPVSSGRPEPGDTVGLNNLAARHYAQGDLARAELLYKAALDRAGSDAPVVATIQSNLAALYKRQARFEDAAALYNSVVDLRHKAPGPDHVDLAMAWNNLAEVYRIQGRYCESRRLLERALALLRSRAAPEDGDLAVVLHNLGGIHMLYQRYDLSRESLETALSIKQRLFGGSHPQVAITLNSLARLAELLQDYREAEQLYLRALTIWQKDAAPEEMAISLTNLGRLYGFQKRFAEAADLHRRALARLEQSHLAEGSLGAAVRHNLANVYVEQNRFDEAEALFRESLSFRQSVLGLEHPVLGPLLSDYAHLLRLAGRRSEARRMEERARDISERNRRENLVGAAVDYRALRSWTRAAGSTAF